MLSPDQIRFIESHLSITVASRDRRFVPSIARCLGCRVNEGDGTVVLWVTGSQNEQLLLDARDCDQLAMVLCDPVSHKTWQIKGDGVVQHEPNPDDHVYIQQHIDGFAQVIVSVGFTVTYASALFRYDPADVVALCFTPRAIYNQTPGPNAGQAIVAENKV